MVELEHVTFAFVVAKRVVLTLAAETTAESVLQHTWGNTGEVLENSVAGDVGHLDSIFLPLRAETEQFPCVVEIQVSDVGCQVLQRFEWVRCNRAALVYGVQVHYAHLAPCSE